MLLDSFLLNITESCCRRFQLVTGRTNVWLAFQLTNLSIIIYFAWAGVHLWSNAGPPRLVLAAFCIGLLYLLSQTVLKVPIETHEKSAFSRVAKGVRNPRRVRDALLRLPFLTLSIVLFYPILLIYQRQRLVVVVLTYSLIVLTTAVLYLLACDPLPPCRGTLRERIRARAFALPTPRPRSPFRACRSPSSSDRS